MKLYKYLLVAAASLSAACTEDAIDDLTGLYQAPDKYSFSSATDNGIEKDGKTKKYFLVDFTTTSGDLLSMKFVGDSYFLQDAAFTPATNRETAKKGNYIASESFFAKAGGASVNINRGILTVGKNDNDYTIAGSLWLEDGKVIKVSGGGTLVYEPNDPMALVGYKGMQDNGDGSVTATFTTGGYTEELDMTTWQMIYTGEGNDLQVQFILPDGKLHEGTYAPGTGYVVGGQTEINWGYGPMMVDYGTIWYTIANGAKVPNYIGSGNIVVTKNGSSYTVTIDQGKGGVFAAYEGAIADLDPDSGNGGGNAEPNYIEISNFLSASVNANTLSLQLAGEGITVTQGAWGAEVQGDGNYLKIDLYTADGSLAEGVYTPADNDKLAEFNFAKGWDPGDMWGIGMEFKNWGTAWMTREGGNETGVNIEEGTITVTKEGDNYVITLVSGSVNVRYTGPITL
ncbi:MAG: hypothetical protein HUJ96_10690 [Marinilabiliaceae bacterium]|mgnify:CR=1 FL=1|nr:hypothetical protein [Marinilabiliaceae bacterium]